MRKILLANAAAFEATSLDGVTVCVPPTKPADGGEITSVSLPQDAPWRYETLSPVEPDAWGRRRVSEIFFFTRRKV